MEDSASIARFIGHQHGSCVFGQPPSVKYVQRSPGSRYCGNALGNLQKILLVFDWRLLSLVVSKCFTSSTETVVRSLG